MTPALVHTSANLDAPRLPRIAVILVGRARGHLQLAHTAGPACLADALEGVHHVHARGTVQTRHRHALVHLRVAIEAHGTVRTDARVRSDVVKARATTFARLRGALVQLLVARAHRNVRVAVDARTRVQRSALRAGTSVQARRRCTLIDVRLTDQATVASQADALVPVEGNLNVGG